MTKHVTERLKLKDLYPERAEALAKEHKIDVEELELVRKGIVAEKAEVDEKERAVTSYINTATKDRDNEIIEPEGAILTHYRKNPVVPYGHDYRGLPVAKNIWIKKDKKGLLAKTVFAKHQFADEVYQLYSEDIAGTGPVMKAWSIGFIPLKWEESPEGKGKPPKEGEMDTRPRRTYKKWELLEYSAVMIPSNREALTEMVAKGLITSEKLKKDIIEIKDIPDDPKPNEKLVTEDNGMSWLYDNYPGTVKELLHDWVDKEVVTKPEETDDYIRLPAKGEEGKHKGHKIRWITVSEKQGIKGIYCIDCKKIITYVFMKSKGWTMEKAKKWMKEHGKGITEAINKWNETDGLELNDDTAELLEEQLEEMFADGEVVELEDKKKKPVVEEEPKQTEREQQITRELFDRLTEQLNKVEEELKSLKEGRVLSSKNRKLVKQCADMLLQLYEATEPPQREEFELEIDLDKTADDKKARIDSTTANDKIEMETSGVTDKIKLILTDNIEKLVEARIKKARGKVE